MQAAGDSPGSKVVDVALAEFSALRAEFNGRQQAQHAALGVALTATGAIGGIAFGKTERLEILLILPLVLSGLGIFYVESTYRTLVMGGYVRTKLWPSLAQAAGDITSWECYVEHHRARRRGGVSTYSALAVAPYALIFGAPGVASLFVVGVAHIHHPAWLWVAWGVGALALLAFGALAILAQRDVRSICPDPPSKRADPDARTARTD